MTVPIPHKLNEKFSLFVIMGILNTYFIHYKIPVDFYIDLCIFQNLLTG
jgi:hypothetical protein